MRFNQEMLHLFKTATPFLSSKGREIISSAQHLAELIQSPMGIKTLNSLSRLQTKDQGLSMDTRSNAQDYNPYSLFLVFYLLILAREPQPLTNNEKGKEMGLPSVLPMPSKERDLNKGGTDSQENPTHPLE